MISNAWIIQFHKSSFSDDQIIVANFFRICDGICIFLDSTQSRHAMSHVECYPVYCFVKMSAVLDSNESLGQRGIRIFLIMHFFLLIFYNL